MKLLFFCSSLEPGRDGVGDYTRRLAGECIRQGHEARIISLNDKAGAKSETLKTETGKSISTFHFPLSTFLERQESESTPVPCLRLPSSLSWAQRVALAREWLEQFNPDWISLQFVPYGFHPKGLPFGLAGRLQRLIGQTPLHLMFHELWIGAAKSSPWPHRIVGPLQQFCIRKLIRTLKPAVVHTSIPVYQAMLAQIGTKAEVLPLFGNIPVADVNQEMALPELTEVGLGHDPSGSPRWLGVIFGTIHPEWKPEPLIAKLREMAGSLGKKLTLVSLGSAGASGEKIWDAMQATHPDLRCIKLGRRSDLTISHVLQLADFGIATTPWQLIGKSGSVAAMLDHGLPVIVTRDDWYLRGQDSPLKEAESRFLTPQQFAVQKILPAREQQKSDESGLDYVVRQLLKAVQPIKPTRS